MALSRYTLDSSGHFPSIARIAEVEKRAPAVVSRAIASALKEGLVQMRPAEEREPVRDNRLEDALKQKHRQLRGVVVIDDSSWVTENIRVRSDRLHRALGRGMADLISLGTLFRDRDRLGVGSGRGVYYTIEALSGKMPLPVEDVSVASLTGSVYAHDHSGELNQMLDADNHTARFAGCFRMKARLELISHPIAFKDAEALRPVSQLTWLNAAEWDQQRPTHALMGVGALCPGHRLHEEVHAQIKNQWLTPVAEYVEPLVMLSDAINARNPHYWPVMDLCNRFFFVEPPNGVALAAREGAKIVTLLEQLNERLLTVTAQQLSDIEAILLVAGGDDKAPLLGRLLTDTGRYPYRVRYLSTDRKTALTLL
jgi:DNA-binding transcriptional regulator LsrR (DeoR family)